MLIQRITTIFLLFLLPFFGQSSSLFDFEESNRFTTSPDTGCNNFTVLINELTPIYCFGDGADLEAFPIAGTPPYNYFWNNGSTDPMLYSVPAGYYEVTVTDDQGCTGLGVWTLSEPQPVSLVPNSYPDTGGSNGVAWVDPIGGTPGFTFNWAMGSTQDTVFGLPTGNYNVTATDANGCTAQSSVFVEDSTSNCNTLNAYIIETIPILCPNFTGDLFAQANGGTAPYTFYWSNGVTDSFNIGVAAGVYDLTVVDAMGCNFLTTWTINEPPPIILTGGSYPETSNGSDGVAWVDVNGANPPYTFGWSNGGSTDTIYGLPTNTYTVMVTDANGCSNVESVFVDVDTTSNCNTLNAYIIEMLPIYCAGGVGDLFAQANGGTAPYTFNWSNGVTDSFNIGVVAGVYDVTVVDAMGCNFITSWVLTESSPMTLVGNSLPETSVGNDGVAWVEVPNGQNHPYSYYWSNGGLQDTITGLTSATYDVTVTDGFGCTAMTSVFVDNDTSSNCTNLVLAMYEINPIYCFAGFGDVQVIPMSGVPPYTYLWNMGANTDMEFGLPAGYYEVTVTDNDGCTGIGFIDLLEPSPISATFSTIDESSPGTGDGSATVYATGGMPIGTPPYSYNWTNGQMTETSSSLNTGWHGVTVTDGNGCTHSDSVFVNVDTTGCNTLNAYIIETTPILCPNFTGDLFAQANGGTAPYSFYWSNGVTDSFNIGVAAGVYDLTVLDAMGCNFLTTWVINEPPPITLTGGSYPETSNGNDGVAWVEIINGTNPPYTFGWSNGATTDTIYGLTTNTYTVVVSDANGCSNIENVFVDVDTTANCNTLNAYIIEMLPINCAGGLGDLFAQVNGGTAPYTFNWSNGVTDSFNVGVVAGVYDVTVVDATGCNFFTTWVLNEPPPMTLIGSSLPETSAGNDGMAWVEVPNGQNHPYSYYWSNGGLQDTITGLPSSTYDVTVIDGFGCSAMTSVYVDNDTSSNCTNLVLSMYEINPIYCYGELGDIEVIPVNGTGPYTYAWNNGANTPTVFGLPAGYYEVTVTDDVGCTGVGFIDLYEPLYLSTTFTTVDESSPGAGDGSATVQVTGGMPNYSYSWTNGEFSETISGLNSGWHGVWVTDANGCAINDSVFVNVDTTSCTLSAYIIETSPVLCAGDFGDLFAVVSGGTSPYSFYWSNGIIDSFNIGVTAGYYDLAVVDAMGCIFYTSWIVNEPPPVIAIAQATNESSAGANDGTAIAMAYGGIYPYTFLWDNGSTSDTLVNLGAGNYSITITDANGCTDATTVTVGSDDAGCSSLFVVATIDSYYNGYAVSCSGSNDGQATVIATGGTQPYAFFWDNGATTATVSGLSAGTYTVLVMDANGCLADALVTIEEPPIIFVDVVSTPETSTGANDGTASAMVSGGSGTYTYVWSNSEVTQTIVGLVPGVYIVSVTDVNGCEGIFTTIVDAAIPDSDGDGIINVNDNCPTIANPGQEDADNDGQGDACTCDPDSASIPTAPGIHRSAYASVAGGWTNYCSETGEILLSLALDGSGALIDDQEVRLQVGIETVTIYGDTVGFVDNGLGAVFLNRNWDVQPEVQPTSNVGVRYYFQQSDFDALNAGLASINASPIPTVNDMQFFKVTDPTLGIFPPLPTIPQTALELIAHGASPGPNTWVEGPHGAFDHYAEYEVYSFSGGGGGGAEGGAPLPVELLSFDARLVDAAAHLNWETAMEINNLGWEIQRLTSSGSWKNIGFVRGKINSDSNEEYTFIDEDISFGSYYYRLAQMDVDGRTTHSKVVVVSTKEMGEKLGVYPNPSIDELIIMNGQGTAKIFNSYGMEVQRYEIENDRHFVDISDLSAGMYFIEIFRNGLKNTSTKFYKVED